MILSYLTTSFLPLRLMTWMSSSSSETRDWSLDRFAGLRFCRDSRGAACGGRVCGPLVVVRRGRDRGGGGASAAPRRAAAGRRQLRVSESRRVLARRVLACARFCGGRRLCRAGAGGGASVAGPRGRVALPRAPASAFQTQSAFGRNRALSGRARAKLWVWTLSTCGATIAAILVLPANQLQKRRAARCLKLELRA